MQVFKDCLKEDSIATTLRDWAEKIVFFAKIILAITIVGGIVKGIITSIDENSLGRTVFLTGVFFTTLIKYGIAAVIEYLVLRLSSQVVIALATNVYHQGCMARIKVYAMKEKEEKK